MDGVYRGMATFDLSTFGPVTFDSGAITITGGAGYVNVCKLNFQGAKDGILIDLLNGANALTGLKLTRAAVQGGVHSDWLLAAAFDAQNNELLDTIPKTGIATLGAGLHGQIKLAWLEGTGELGIWAQCTVTTTIQATGTAYD